MKKNNFVQLIIIIIAVVFGIYSLKYIMFSLLSVLYMIFAGSSLGNGYFISPLLELLSGFIQVVICWYMTTKSADIAAYICKTAAYNGSVKLTSRPSDLLFILLVTTGIYFLLDAAAPLAKGIILAFRSKAPHSSFDEVQVYKPTDWLGIVLQIAFPLLLLMFSKHISEYFSKNLSAEEIEMAETNSDHLNNFED